MRSFHSSCLRRQHRCGGFQRLRLMPPTQGGCRIAGYGGVDVQICCGFSGFRIKKIILPEASEASRGFRRHSGSFRRLWAPGSRGSRLQPWPEPGRSQNHGFQTISETILETILETPGEQDGSKNMDFQRIWGSVLELFLEFVWSRKVAVNGGVLK